MSPEKKKRGLSAFLSPEQEKKKNRGMGAFVDSEETLPAKKQRQPISPALALFKLKLAALNQAGSKQEKTSCQKASKSSPTQLKPKA